jgi:Spy/CpxP family protein refolding chaperone
MTTKRTIGFLASALLMVVVSIPAVGQPQPGGAGGGPGGRFDPAQMRQRMLDRIKETIGATDDEFKALEPKIDQVMTAQREAMSFGFRRGPGGGGPGGDPNAPTTPVQEKTKDLKDALDNKDTKPEEIKAKMAALREARIKARENLVKAQKDLSELLTQRQEAGLVMMGFLD